MWNSRFFFDELWISTATSHVPLPLEAFSIGPIPVSYSDQCKLPWIFHGFQGESTFETSGNHGYSMFFFPMKSLKSPAIKPHDPSRPESRDRPWSCHGLWKLRWRGALGEVGGRVSRVSNRLDLCWTCHRLHGGPWRCLNTWLFKEQKTMVIS